MKKDKRFWLGLCFVNLAVVAFMGLLLRSKILFSIPFLDYRNMLNAHSHLAFSGWVGLALFAFFVYDILPAGFAEKKIYQRLLWGVEITSIGMALSFPFQGYGAVSLLFSTLFILITYIFSWRFIQDLRSAAVSGPVQWFSVAAVLSLALSSTGPFGLAYLMASGSTDALLHRDALYTFLHFQYNGFFTLGIFAVYFHGLAQQGAAFTKSQRWFSVLLIASVLPSLFLSLLWHNLTAFYMLALVGCVLIFLTLVLFIDVYKAGQKAALFQHPLSKLFWVASFASFAIKMLLTLGNIYEPLGNAVYGARPVIIGFLHLVFLGFVSFFILSKVMEEGWFIKKNRLVVYPFVIFGAGIVANEVLLMLQGLEVLFQTNNPSYNRGLWGAAIVLFIGAAAIAFTHYQTRACLKNAAK